MSGFVQREFHGLACSHHETLAVICRFSVHRVAVCLVNLEFLCHLSNAFLSGHVSGVLFLFLKRWEFFKNNFSLGLALQALLQFLVCVLACANCKCACF